MKELDIALKLKKCNETVKNLYGAEFETEIKQYKRFINAAILKHSLPSPLEGAMKLMEDARGMDGADMFTVKVLAACVELMEGRS